MRFFKKFFIFFLGIFFCSCILNNTSMEDYLLYWTETVKFIDYRIVDSKYITIDSIENISAEDQKTHIRFYLINGQRYKIEPIMEPSGLKFSVLDENGKSIEVKANIKYEQDFNYFDFTCSLLDKYEKQELTIQIPYKIIKSDEYFETSLIEWKFKQNTTPDLPMDLYSSPDSDKVITKDGNNYHYLQFKLPDQRYNRNHNLHYTIECFERDAVTNSIKFIDKEENVVENLNPQNNDFFWYYSKKQENNIQYEYRVTTYNDSGLQTQMVSSDPSIGVSYVFEPEITFKNAILTKDNKQLIVDGKKYEQIDYETLQNITIKIKDINEEDILNPSKMTIVFDGEIIVTDELNKVLTPGKHEISITMEKNLCRTLVIEKKYFVTPKLDFENGGYYGWEGESQIAYYSYIEGDDLNCFVKDLIDEYDIYISVGGNEKIGLQDGETQVNNSIPKGKHYVEVFLEKSNCTTIVIKKILDVRQKQTNITIKKIYLNCEEDDGDDDVLEIFGKIYVYSNITGNVTLFNYPGGSNNEGDVKHINCSGENGKYKPKQELCSCNSSLILEDTSSSLRFIVNLTEYDASSGNDIINGKEFFLSLKDLKKYMANGLYNNYYITDVIHLPGDEDQENNWLWVGYTIETVEPSI